MSNQRLKLEGAMSRLNLKHREDAKDRELALRILRTVGVNPDEYRTGNGTLLAHRDEAYVVEFALARAGEAGASDADRAARADSNDVIAHQRARARRDREDARALYNQPLPNSRYKRGDDASRSDAAKRDDAQRADAQRGDAAVWPKGYDRASALRRLADAGVKTNALGVPLDQCTDQIILGALSVVLAMRREEPTRQDGETRTDSAGVLRRNVYREMPGKLLL